MALHGNFDEMIVNFVIYSVC